MQDDDLRLSRRHPRLSTSDPNTFICCLNPEKETNERTPKGKCKASNKIRSPCVTCAALVTITLFRPNWVSAGAPHGLFISRRDIEAVAVLTRISNRGIVHLDDCVSGRVLLKYQIEYLSQSSPGENTHTTYANFWVRASWPLM